jgi:hypothetical protein
MRGRREKSPLQRRDELLARQRADRAARLFDELPVARGG